MREREREQVAVILFRPRNIAEHENVFRFSFFSIFPDINHHASSHGMQLYQTKYKYNNQRKNAFHVIIAIRLLSEKILPKNEYGKLVI